MARPLRIEYPGAFYHIYSRGDQKQPIFFSDEDRCYFLHCLRMAFEKFGAVIHAYCLMPNHFHFLIETPLGDLSRIMHFVMTKYTVYINKKHKRQGHLFQGRYGSVLIESVSYAKELARYVHLNPVRSKIVDKPEDFEWSSYGYYLGLARPEKWLETASILSLFGDSPAASIKAFVEFVNEGIGREPAASIRESKRTGILGSEEFIKRIKRDHLGEVIDKPDRGRPQLRKLREKPDLTRILSLSERSLGPANRWVVPIAVLVAHGRTAARLCDIGEFFSLSVSGVSSAISRARSAIAGNPALAGVVKDIETELDQDG